jgi:6,7-dimethyl-8-ribityllumazine synthase
MKIKARIAIVVSEFNKEFTGNLVSCCLHELNEQGVKLSQVKTVWVPGAYELPYAAMRLAKTKKFDAVICFGCVIKGETSHDFHVANWAAIGVGQVSLTTGVPTFFGVLTPNNEAQARKRSRPGPLNRGKEVAEAAVAMIRLQQTKEI